LQCGFLGQLKAGVAFGMWVAGIAMEIVKFDPTLIVGDADGRFLGGLAVQLQGLSGA